MTFRSGFYIGLIAAVAVGLWLWQLWEPVRQVELHSEHLMASLERKEWENVADFIDEAYHDQWGQDRAVLLARLREVLRYARNLRLDAHSRVIRATDAEGEWSARIRVEADSNEVSEFIKARVNPLETPFELRWQRKSRKPWDWKLVRVSNSGLELPNGGF